MQEKRERGGRGRGRGREDATCKHSQIIPMQRTLSDMLELGAFSCTDDVIVQYAAVNKYGRSNGWSPPTEIDVYGGKRERTRVEWREGERESGWGRGGGDRVSER